MWIPRGAALVRGRHLYEAQCLLEEIQYAYLFYIQKKQQLKDVLEKGNLRNFKELPGHPRTSYEHFVYIQFESCVH